MEWQSIETAPENGAKILVYTKGGVCQVYWGGEYKPYWNTSVCEGEQGYAAYLRFDPTHWMPLPESPKEST